MTTKRSPKSYEFWLPCIVLCLGIFAASHVSRPPSIDIEFEMQDKVLHFIAYFTLGCSVLFGVFGKGYVRPKVFVPIVVFACAFYGATDEMHQYFVPGRSLDVFDWVADVLGGIAATAAYKPVFAIVNWYREYRSMHGESNV